MIRKLLCVFAGIFGIIRLCAMGSDGERINLCIVGGGPGGLYRIEPRCAADVGAFWNACRTKFRVYKTEMV